MKVLDVVNVRGRGTLIFCVPDIVVTADMIRSPGIVIHSERYGRKRTRQVIGIERHCVSPSADQTVGLLVRGENLEYGLWPGDEIEVAAYICKGIRCEDHNYVLDSCSCEPCACGHCIHEHEKWRWHRACSICTPLFYEAEVPNEVRNNVRNELDRHRPL